MHAYVFTFKFTHVYKLSLLQHSLTHYLYMEKFITAIHIVIGKNCFDNYIFFSKKKEDILYFLVQCPLIMSYASP